jgi:AcrR family transcriptional regulator
MSHLLSIEDSAQGGPEPLDPFPGARRPHNPPRRFVTRNEHDQIQAAVARAIAAKGYEATTEEDICAEAHIALRVFHEHFPGKQEAAISALEAGADQRMAHCQEAFQLASTWPEAIWAACEAYTDWMANEPDFARLGLVEILAIGPPGRELLRSLLDAFALFLQPGYRFAPRDTPSARTVDESVADTIFGLLHGHVVEDSPETLPTIVPELARAVLTPFLGAERAEAFVADQQAGASGR